MAWADVIKELEDQQSVCATWMRLLSADAGEVNVTVTRHGQPAFSTDSETDLAGLREGLHLLDSSLHVQLSMARRNAEVEIALAARKAVIQPL